MTLLTDEHFRAELVARRRRLERVPPTIDPGKISALLAGIDEALDRLDCGTFHRCTVCDEDIQLDRFVADPLARCCWEHQTPDEASRLERDLALARSIQLGLLPAPGRSIDGWQFSYRYEAAGDVGGDFCDVIPLASEGTALVLVGDVSGKGIAAALLMASLLATFRSLSGLGLPAGELLTRANDLFHASTPPGTFATLSAATLQPDGIVDVYSAGHWPPLVRTGRSAMPAMVEPGLPLGAFTGSRYEPTRLELTPGKTLLFYTDGAVEAEDAIGRDYGAPRLAEVLAGACTDELEALVARCVRDVRRFQDGRRAADDLLLFGLQAHRAGRSRAPHVA